MNPFFSQIKVKSFLTVAFIFLSFAVSYSQDAGAKREIIEAIDYVKTGKYEEAIPVLKKYSDAQELDDLTLLETNTYLSLCYLVTEEGVKDVDRLNRLTDFYLEKHGITKTDSLKREAELGSLFFISVFNNSVENYEEMVHYLLVAKNNFTEGWESRKDELTTETFKLLTRGYYYLGDYNSAIENGVIAYKLNIDFWGEKNIGLLEILDLLYLSYNNINESEKALKYLQKYIEIGKEIIGEKHPDYLINLNNLAISYSALGDYKSSIVIYKQVVDLQKEILGDKHPDYLTSLSNLAFDYLDLGDYQSALTINKQVADLRKEILGEKHPDYLTSLSNLASSYSFLGNYQSSLAINQQVIESTVEVLGAKHPDYLTSLSNLAVSYSGLGDYQMTLAINQQVVDLRKEILGEMHPDYIVSLNNLAASYSLLGDYQLALQINQQVVELSKALWGEMHPKYLMTLNNLAQSYSNLGNYRLALEINQKVVDLLKMTLGEKHPDYLSYLNNLASAYSNLGDYQSALAIIQQVVELGKEVWGDKHPSYLTSLNNLSAAFSDLGNYQKALEINLQLDELKKEVLGERHPDYFRSLNNLANSYSNLGIYKTALEIELKVLPLTKEILGEEHPQYLTTLGNLASSFSYLGDYQSALKINQQVVELKKKVLGEIHPNYLGSLNNLASSYSDFGDYELALTLNKQVLEGRKEVLGEKHPDYLSSLSYLAFSYSMLGDYQAAMDSYQQVLEGRKEVLGEKHPDYIISLFNLASSELDFKKNDAALSHIIQGLNLSQKRANEYFGQLTEYQREQFWKKISLYFNIFPLFLENTSNSIVTEINYLYDFSLFTKGILLNTSNDFEKLISEKGSSESIAKYQELKLQKFQIQKLYEKPITERYLNVDSLETVAQKLETELVKLSKEYGDYTQNLKINWKDVQANLGEKDVAVEFLEYPTFTDTVKYAALVLRKGWANPKFISLFRIDQIQEFINLDKNQIYSYGFIGKEMKKLVWSPLEEYISPGDRVYFSAAGILHQLAVENLSFDESTTLGDRYQIYRLSSTKELALQKPESKTQSVALYGGLKYDLELSQMITESEKYKEKNTFYASRGIDQDTIVRKGWQFLPGTLSEANEVSQILKDNRYQVSEFIGNNGSEESFKDLSGKRTGIIHIATHGFFLPVEQSKRNPFIQLRFDDQNENIRYVDPMLRSGLLFAGGNRAWQGDSIPDTIEDGILTAKEISHLDLRETDLVVLSACETGLGDVSSEGVFGLQRAFKQAGAQTIIMSLWNVKDEATQYLMTNFYSYLMQGASKREAFIQARNKCRKQYQDPASWAAFIMLD